jgi:hypothetical protein
VVEGAPASSLGWLLISTRRANRGIVDLNLLVDMNSGLLQAAASDGLEITIVK